MKYSHQKHIKFPTGQRSAETVAGFQDRWIFSQCCGAIDGTHIPIQAPKNCNADYYSRNGFYSIQAQAVCDHRCIFTNLTVGWPGKVHDARVFANSSIFRRFDGGGLVNNSVKVVDGVEVPVPESVLTSTHNLCFGQKKMIINRHNPAYLKFAIYKSGV